MAVYAGSMRRWGGTVNPAATANTVFEIVPGARSKPAILEVHVYGSSATTAVSFGLIRPSVAGTPLPKQPFEFVDESEGTSIPATTKLVTDWSRAPTYVVTAATPHIRRTSQTTAGYGTIWTFGAGLPIPVGQTVVMWSVAATANQITTASIVIEE